MILSHHKTKWNQPQLPNVYMLATVSMLCMFFCVYDVTYIKTQFNHSKFCCFISLREKFFFHKINKNMHSKPGIIFLYIHRYDNTHARFKFLELHNFVRTEQNTTKLCTRLFFHKVIKIIPWNFLIKNLIFQTDVQVSLWVQPSNLKYLWI